MNNATRNLLLVAAREPRPGITKTRLGQTIGMDRAAALYAAFLQDLATELIPLPGSNQQYTFGWAFTPADVNFRGLMMEFDPRFARDDMAFVPQFGDDWGARQTNLLHWGHAQGFERTVLIASDSPHLKRSMITSAFASLDTNEVVMGCVHDGGYYLIGVRGFHDVLSGVPMSTSSAADAVRARTLAFGLRLTEIAPTFDVDTNEDLNLLFAELSPCGANAPATWRARHRLGLVANVPASAHMSEPSTQPLETTVSTFR